jgi:hypothetical protein
MPCCTYVKLNGALCGRSHGAQFDFCANHRPRDAVRQFQACAACGAMTRLTNPKTGAPLCIKQSCGMYTHQAECKRRKKAAAAELAARKKAAAEEARNQDAAAEALEAYVAELFESFDAAAIRPAPPPPPAAWNALSDTARAELMGWIRQAIEADLRDAKQQAAAPGLPGAVISSH